MNPPVPSALAALLSPDRIAELRMTTGSIGSVLPDTDAPRTPRFEGLYGRLYNRMVQSSTLRRAFFGAWGGADSLYDLGRFVGDAIASAAARVPEPVLVDVPCGGGTLLPFMAREGFSGRVVEVDLAGAMLRRAVALHGVKTPALSAMFLQADALDLPLADNSADLVVSVNGLHVVPDHARFLHEMARILRPGGQLWLITPVTGQSLRSRGILGVASRLGVTAIAPPTLAQLRSLLEAAGLRRARSYGGVSITGLVCEKP